MKQIVFILRLKVDLKTSSSDTFQFRHRQIQHDSFAANIQPSEFRIMLVEEYRRAPQDATQKDIMEMLTAGASR